MNAPRIKEYFLNLECEYVWEKEITPGSGHVVMCVKIVNICMDEAYYNTEQKGRYGETGYLYNIHSPRNPETGKKMNHVLESSRSFINIMNINLNFI